MPSSITEQIRALKDFPRWELGERGEVIKVQIEQLELLHPAADIVLNKQQAGYCTGYELSLGGSDE